MNSHNMKEDTPLLQVLGSDNSLATAIHPNLGSSEMPVASPLEAAADDLTQACSLEGGAVGGKPPQSSHRRFDAAVEEADEDFSSHDETADKPKPSKSSQKQPNQNLTTKPYAKYFKDGIFPRYLVIKHQNPNKNIVTENQITISKALKDVVSNRHFQRCRIKRQYNSRLLLIEADEKITAERLLETRSLMHIPVKVEVHQSKNSCKGVIFNDYYDMTDDEMRDALSSQLITNTYRIVNRNGEKTRTIILTFACENPPETIRLGDHDDFSARVYPYKQKPRQCNKCLVFGHGPKFCRQTKICHKCAMPADHKADSCTNIVRCFNCEGDHSALSHECPQYKFEEAVIAHKENTRTDIESSRTHILRTHSITNQIPKLKQKRDNLPKLYAQVTTAGPTSNPPGNHSQQRRPPTGLPQQLAHPPQDPNLLSKIDEMLTSKLAPLVSIPQQLNDLQNSMATTTKQQQEEISSLRNTLQEIQNTVDILINIPIIKDQYIKALAERDCANQNLGALPEPKGSAGDSLPPPLKNTRKSRSREKNRGRTNPQSRSQTPAPSVRVKEPTTPSRSIKRKNSETSPTSGGENQEDSSSSKNTAGGGKEEGLARKACRSSSQGPGRPSQAEAASAAVESESSHPPEVVINPANLHKGGKKEPGTNSKMIRTRYT